MPLDFRQWHMMVNAPHTFALEEGLPALSWSDYNPSRKTIGWDDVKFPPADITTSLHLNDNGEAQAMDEYFSRCATCTVDRARSNKACHLRCGGCRVMRYCGKGCQRAHWKLHKKNCVLYKKMYYDLRVTDNYINLYVTAAVYKEARQKSEPFMAFGWTRTLWDAAKEVHWYYVNNNQPHLNGLRNADLAGPNPKFIDFVRKIEDEANGPPPNPGLARFHNTVADMEYLRAEQEKLRANEFHARGLPVETLNPREKPLPSNYLSNAINIDRDDKED